MPSSGSDEESVSSVHRLPRDKPEEDSSNKPQVPSLSPTLSSSLPLKKKARFVGPTLPPQLKEELKFRAEGTSQRKGDNKLVYRGDNEQWSMCTMYCLGLHCHTK